MSWGAREGYDSNERLELSGLHEDLLNDIDSEGKKVLPLAAPVSSVIDLPLRV